MASSNIKLFDENKGNMLSDSEFSISNQRMNGLQTGVASSQLQNKAMYQASLIAYAIAQIMMQNGKNANDTDAVSAFVANLSSTILQKVYDAATTEEAKAGVATGKWMSPALVKVAIDTLAAKAQNILSDETKATYGLGADAVPDDLFKIFGAELRVTTEAGTTVTASRNGVTLSATADSSGLAILKIPTFGTWTLKATINGLPVEVPFVIDAIAVFNTVLAIKNLEDTPWGIISAVAEAGNAASFWSVGDKKIIKLNEVSYTAQIIGFNHDNKTAGGKAGITFQLVDCLNTRYKMNSSKTNSGGWTSCAMRSRMDEFFGQLDDDLQNAIKAVNKLTSAGSQSATINTTSDKLFLLSEVEIFGSATTSKPGEGSQYAYYKAGNSKVKKLNGKAYEWWERSPFGNSSSAFCHVRAAGDEGDVYGGEATLESGVSFGFCV